MASIPGSSPSATNRPQRVDDDIGQRASSRAKSAPKKAAGSAPSASLSASPAGSIEALNRRAIAPDPRRAEVQRAAVMPPSPPLSPELVDGALAFSADLTALNDGIALRSGDGLIVAFLRLQMLDQTQKQQDDLTSDLLRRDMRTTAHEGATTAMNVFFSQNRRAGTEALLRDAEDKTQAKNALLALLSGDKPDQKGRRNAIQEIDEKRQEVAQLVLNVIDKHLATNAAMRPISI